jgi:hypothetical protein
MTDWRDQSWNWWEKERRAAATARAEQAEAAEADLRARCAARTADGCTYIRIADVLAALDAQRPAEEES